MACSSLAVAEPAGELPPRKEVDSKSRFNLTLLLKYQFKPTPHEVASRAEAGVTYRGKAALSSDNWPTRATSSNAPHPPPRLKGWTGTTCLRELALKEFSSPVRKYVPSTCQAVLLKWVREV